MAESWRMYAMRMPYGWDFVYSHAFAVRMCGNLPVEAVTVSLDPEGSHWGWMATGEDEPRMIQPSEVQLKMCFPYGMAIEVKQGRGKPVRLSIERAADAPATGG